MSTQQPTIIYTLTDEAPLPGHCFVPADRAHLRRAAGINVDHERHLGGGPRPG
jgi:monomeric isocitrate dehydrogenase